MTTPKKPIAVRVELMAECHGGNLERRTWSELYSTAFHHPYNTNENSDFLADCDGNNEAAFLCAIVGDRREWLNDDISFLSDRMTCGIGDVHADWQTHKNELETAIVSTLADGTPRMLTISASADDFATFRVTAIDRIPDAVSPISRDECGPTDIDKPMPERAFIRVANAVRRANGDPEHPLPKIKFRVRFQRIDEGTVEVEADTADAALADARSRHPSDGVWLQSDPDHALDDWAFDIV